MLQDRRLVLILTIGLCLLYLGVRLWRLTDSCLWFDEIFSVHAAEHEWGSLFWFVALDLIHPPLSYVLLKLWIGIGGDGLLWVRLFPVAFSTLALFPFLHLCRELKLKRSATLLALSFLAVNGCLIKYAQEVRMYAPLLFFSLLSLWLFARFYFRGKNIWILTLVNILLIYTHYFGWLVILAQVVMIFVFQRVKIRHVLIMSGIALVAFVPWIIALLKAANTGADVTQNIGWMARPGVRAILTFAFDTIEPFYFQQSSAEPTTILYITLPLLIAIGVAMLLFLLEWKEYEAKGVFYLMSVFVIIPLIVALVVSWIAPVSIWGSRHLIIVFAPISILVAILVTNIGRRAARYGAIVLVTLIFAVGFVRAFQAAKPAYVWCGWDNLADKWVLSPYHSSGPKKLYVFEDLVAYHFWFEMRTFPNHRVTLLTGLDGIANDPAYFLPRGFDGVSRQDFAEVSESELWIAFRKEVPDDDGLIAFLDPIIGTPLSDFQQRGYGVQDVQRIKIGTETCFLIKLSNKSSP